MPIVTTEPQAFEALARSYLCTHRPLSAAHGAVLGSDGCTLGLALLWLLQRVYPRIASFMMLMNTPLPAPFTGSDRIAPSQLVALAREWLPRAGLRILSEARVGGVHNLRPMAGRLMSASERRPYFLYVFWGGGASEDEAQRCGVMAFDTAEATLYDGNAGEAKLYQATMLAVFYWAWVKQKAIPESNGDGVVFELEMGPYGHFVG
jgi:hypothetical protein